jgi:hypothetical protein
LKSRCSIAWAILSVQEVLNIGDVKFITFPFHALCLWVLRNLKECLRLNLVAPAYNPSEARGRGRKLSVQAKAWDWLYLKNNYSKKDWGMAQVVDCLSSKHKALSQIPVLPKKKKKRNSLNVIS